MIPVPGGVRVSAAAVSAVAFSVGCLLLTAAAVNTPATVVGTFLVADMVLAGIALALLPIAILMPPVSPYEPRILGIPAWLVRRALGVTREIVAVEVPDHGTVAAARASTPSTTC